MVERIKIGVIFSLVDLKLGQAQHSHFHSILTLNLFFFFYGSLKNIYLHLDTRMELSFDNRGKNKNRCYLFIGRLES